MYLIKRSRVSLQLYLLVRAKIHDSDSSCLRNESENACNDSGEIVNEK